MELEECQSLSELFSCDPNAVRHLVDELAEELKDELSLAMESDALFLRQSNDWGEVGFPPSGDESIKGWRLFIPEGRISYRGWGETGILVAYLEASVDDESILQHAKSGTDFDSLIEDEEAYQDAEEQARLSLRGVVEPQFLSRDPRLFMIDYATFDNCREAIVNALLQELDFRESNSL